MERIRLRIEKEGFHPFETTVVAPESGSSKVYLALVPSNKDPQQGTANVRVAPAAVPAERPAAAAPRRSERRTARVRPSPARSRSKPAPSSAAPVAARLVVAFTPQDATLSVDGTVVAGRSPATVDDLKPGRHNLMLRADGYEGATRVIELSAGERHSINVSLRSVRARLEVVARPESAEIIVDGRSQGRGYVRGLELSPGKSHRIEARAAGYEMWSTTITPSAGANPPVVATLKKVAESTPTPVAAPVATREVTVPKNMVGDKNRGQRLFAARCGASCHGSGMSAVVPGRYTQAQWARYFASRRHSRHEPFGARFTQAELADVKAYMMSKAGDVMEGGAGLR